MKKLFKVMFVAILAIAVAAPAMAEVKVNGYIRTIMQADNVDGYLAGQDADPGTAGIQPFGPGVKDAKTVSEVDNRLRALITNQLTDDVKWVYYGEVDTKWGQDTGGKLGADGVQLQTKNVYMSFNVPNTMFGVSLGVQGFSPGFDGIVLAHDAAGAKVNMAVSDNVSVEFDYAKFDEGNVHVADDTDYYSVVAKMKNGLSLAAIHIDDNGSKFDEDTAGKDSFSYLGAEYKGKAGDIGINAWALYNFGTFNDGAVNEGDVTGYAATVQAVMGSAAVRVTYLSGDDGTSGNDSDAFIADLGGDGGTYYFTNENLQIFPCDPYYMNLGSTAIIAKGNGVMAINAKYDTMVGDYYLKLGAGYFQSAEDNAAGDADMGYEIAARMGKKIAEKVDVSVNGAYAGIGDYFGTNTDDIFKANLMVNLPF